MNLIIGRKPVLEAINSGEHIDQIYIQYGQKGSIITAIQVSAKKRKIKCSLIPSEKFNKLTLNHHSQGVAAKRSDYKFYQLSEVISSAKSSKYPLILLLDSVQDTHNLGAILRTAECAGVHGIILTRHQSAPVNETVYKTSTGAVEYVKIVQVNNLNQTIKELKENGFWIVGSYLENSEEENSKSKVYNDMDYNIPIALIVGNEEKGIRRLTADNCDFLVNIPMSGKIQSLNVSVAAGILLFEILRQRK